LLADLLARHQLARLLKQHQQNLQRLLLQSHASAAPAQFPRAPVQLKLAETDTFHVFLPRRLPIPVNQSRRDSLTVNG
jgi:hypothetical protein